LAKQQRHTRKRYHTVQKGDTLWIISQRYGLEIGQLKKRNKIRGNSIKPGQKLIIST
jgi:membrane-bound lytic murein transglycosylase D